ncbi:MAG: NAD(P)/FAD-dependent oxidoreductase [Chloroflexi bacterium]|nr:NAD(P)/FAD-dependent oxidoreductase [Chloroflexota bacterium]
MTPSDRPTVGIIGGGVTGLTAAYRLLQRGHAVRLFEANETLGGLVRTFEVGGEPIECFYHHLFTSDAAANRLFDELGVADRVSWHSSRVGVFHEGRIYPFTTPLDLLRFSPLGPLDRVRLGLTAMKLRRESDGGQFEDVSAADWMRQHAGERAADVVWGPLLRGKFGVQWDQVVMTWLWNKIRLRFSSRSGRMSQHEVLGYMRGSFGAWIGALAQRVRDLGGQIETGRAVRRIVSDAGRITVEVQDETIELDAVVSTVSNDVLLRIAPDLPEIYAEKLRGTRYQDALCLVLCLDRPLTEYYWLNVSDPDAPFVAVVEHTNLVDSARYGNRHIVYVSNYLESDSPLLREEVDSILRRYLPHLKRINPAFDESWIVERHLFHARDAQPVFTIGARTRIPDHRTSVPRLYLANMAQIYPQDRGQNYSIELGERIAEVVAEDLARTSAPRYQV